MPEQRVCGHADGPLYCEDEAVRKRMQVPALSPTDWGSRVLAEAIQSPAGARGT